MTYLEVRAKVANSDDPQEHIAYLSTNYLHSVTVAELRT